MAKQSNWIWAVILIAGILIISGTIDISGIIPDFGAVDGGLVSVNKQIKFHLRNKYSGAPIDTAASAMEMYDSDGETPLETGAQTDANGHWTTSSDYPSGKLIYVRYEDGNNKQWFQLMIPQMNAEDAESATYNIIELESFAIGTYTTDSMDLANGTAITDGDTYNCSSSSDNPHFTYGLANTGADNTGLMTSDDPVYKQNWDIELYITFSGTDYEKIIIYSLSYDFTLGTVHYVGTGLDAYKLTKHKVGNDYKSLGTQDTTFWIDTTGLTASADVTMQVYVYAYADHVYAQNHGGNFGPEAVQLAEHTLLHIYN